MHGLITTYDSRKRTGHVQGDDGLIYDFLFEDDDDSAVLVEMEVSFQEKLEGERRIASELKILHPEKADEHELFYHEPPTFEFYTSDLVDGYALIDRGIYKISRTDRTEAKAQYRLQSECEAVGANAVVSYSATRIVRNSFGNGYEVYTVSGVPIVMAKRVPEDETAVRMSDLKGRLDQRKIKKNHDVLVNTKIGKLVIKFLAAVMLLIFLIGFIVTGGV